MRRFRYKNIIKYFVISLASICTTFYYLSNDEKIYRNSRVLNKYLKYILLWTQDDYAPFYYLAEGQTAFIKNNCSVTKCYVTSDRDFFNGDVTKFDAIAFNGRNTHTLAKYDLPARRLRRQIYIYVNMESADNYPECRSMFNNFYNWTATYRLDSDIPSPYILVKDKNGKKVGPRVNMTWENDMDDVDEEFKRELKKNKAVAWFVSNCRTASKRERFVHLLQKILQSYNLDVDIYGACGSLKCETDSNECDMILKDYHFYLSFENSFSEDYVTEKVLRALSNNVVPVVLGGANYSRFLPPGSYLKADNPRQLAADIHKSINSSEYYNYFKWKSHYSFSDPVSSDNVCALCAALHNRTMMKTRTVYRNFTSWWNYGYAEKCSKNFFNLLLGQLLSNRLVSYAIGTN